MANSVEIHLTIQQTQAGLNNQNFTFNQAGHSFNQAGDTFEGVYKRNEDVVPNFSLLTQQVIPRNITFDDLGGVRGQFYPGQAIGGLLLDLTYPTYFIPK